MRAAGTPPGRRPNLELLEGLDGETAELLFRDVAAVASPREREAFAGLEPDAMPAFFRSFWHRRHPLPAEEDNPRLGEHYRRLARALEEYALGSNGGGYFTDPEAFRRYSPELPYYDPMLLFEEGAAGRYWLDHRGLVFLRHGEPDLETGPRRVRADHRNDSWLLTRYQARPLIFNFVERRPFGEWTLVLNLGVAATTFGTTPDDPESVLRDVSNAFRSLYRSRGRIHRIYGEVAGARSAQALFQALSRESRLMAAFVKASLSFDSTGYYTEENTLPLRVSVTNFYEAGRPAMSVAFAVDLSEVEPRRLGPEPSVEATVLLFEADWTEEVGRLQETFPLVALEGDRGKKKKKKKGTGAFLGRLAVTGLEPMEYRMAVQVYQPESGRVGIAKGRQTSLFVPADGFGMSDLSLLQPFGKERPEAPEGAADGGWLPVPSRLAARSEPIRVGFELYNLEPDASGAVRYEVEEMVLTLREKPGILDRIADAASLAGRIFFPVYTLAAEVGAFTLQQALAGETGGLETAERTEERSAAPAVEEEMEFDFSQLRPGVYTVYVTARDLNSDGILSRFLTFGIR